MKKSPEKSSAQRIVEAFNVLTQEAVGFDDVCFRLKNYESSMYLNSFIELLIMLNNSSFFGPQAKEFFHEYILRMQKRQRVTSHHRGNLLKSISSSPVALTRGERRRRAGEIVRKEIESLTQN